MPNHITCQNCGARIALADDDSNDPCHVVACPACGVVTDYDEEDVRTEQPPTLPAFIPDAMKHFLDLAHRGSAPACSSGERSAKALADAIIDHVPRLDDEAIDGLCRFAHHAKFLPSSAADLY